MVYVKSKNKKALMPCTNVIARLLLKQGKAKVVRCKPFTIKLTYNTSNYLQDLTLGIDTGSKTAAFAVSNSKNEIVYMSEVIVRNDVTDKMKQRASFRRNRRYRKTAYRKPRWLNRKNSIKDDRYCPTIVSKLSGHTREIEYIKSILPISKIVIESGKFDPHLMKNPLLANEKIRPWGYQQGPNYGFENTKAMVLARDNYTCQYCKGKHKDSRLNVHHIVFQSKNGSNDSDNLITLCETCHNNLHAGKIQLKLKGKSKGTLKHATQMNVICKQLFRIYPEAIETFGYVTKANRLQLKIDKQHYYDACVISTGGNPFIVKSFLYKKRCIPKGDYKQTRGIRSEQLIPTGKIFGFRKFDKVKYFGQEYFIKGRMSSGYVGLMDIDGNKIDFSYMPKGKKTPKLSLCKRVSTRKSVIVKEIKYGKTC